MKLQKHNTEANGVKYRSGLHCTARVLKTEGVCLSEALPCILAFMFHLQMYHAWSSRLQFLLSHIHRVSITYSGLHSIWYFQLAVLIRFKHDQFLGLITLFFGCNVREF